MLKKLFKKYNALSVQTRATLWFFVCSVLQKGISVITTPIFTRLLSTSEYGQYTVFNSWLSILTVVITLSLTSGVFTMGIVKFKEEQKIFTSSLQGLNLVLCLFWTLIYLLFRNFWNNLFSLTTVQMLAMLLMIWSTSTFNFWMTEQRNDFRYRALIIVTLVVSIAKPIIGIIGVLNANNKVTARILGLAIAEFAGYSWCFFIQMRRGKKFFSAKYWKYAILFNLPLIPHYLSNTVLSSADRIMIQRMIGESEAGIYGLAYSISMIMQMVNEALNKTMSPWLYQRMRDKNFKAIPKVVYTSLVIIAGANLLLIAVAPEVVSIFAPSNYYEAIYVIPPVAMSLFAQYLYLCFAPFEFYYEKQIWTTIGTLTSAICNIVLNIIFINIFGYFAAGYTTLVCYSINSCMHYFFMRRVCKQYINNIKPYNPKILLLIAGIFMGLGFIYIPMYSNIIIRYIFTATLLFVIFLKRNRFIPTVKQMLG